MLTLSRRGLIALGGSGAAGVALAACGAAADPRADTSQDELLQAELVAETALAGAYRQAAGTLGSGGEAAALKQFAAAAEKRAARFRDLVSDPDAGSDAPAPDGGPDSPEALAAAATLANRAIAAHRRGAGLLDETESRALASSSLIACAAELAAVNHFSGAPVAPDAFVTGGEDPPHEAAGAESTTTPATTAPEEQP